MKRMITLTIALLTVLCFSAFPAEAKIFGDLSIVAKRGCTAENSVHGYIEYQFAVVNRSTERGHVLTLELSSEVLSYPLSELGVIRRTVNIPAGVSMCVSLFRPNLYFKGKSVRVFIDGQRQNDKLSVDDHFTSLRSCSPLVLVDSGFDIDIVKKKVRCGYTIHFVDAPLDQWSTDWLSYTRYDGVVVPARQYEKASLELREALLRYVETGGILVMIGNTEVPSPWSANSLGGYGNLRSYAVGFGKWWLLPSEDLAALSEDEGSNIGEDFGAVAMAWYSSRELYNAESRLPVIKKVNVSIWKLILFLFIFVLLVGPVNCLILWKMNREIWIFWTFPVISLFVAGFIFAYTIFAEGFDLTVRAASFTLFDEASNRFASLGEIAFYSPFSDHDGIRFPRDTDITPCISMGRMRMPIHAYGLEVDWENDLHLGRGWLSARAPRYFMIRICGAGTERLNVKSLSDGELEVINAFNKRIEELWICDAAGKCFHGRNLEPGSVHKLGRETSKIVVGHSWKMISFLCSKGEWTTHIRGLKSKVDDLLSPGTYLAQFVGSPFYSIPVKNGSDMQEESFVLGIMKETDRSYGEDPREQ